MRTSLCVLSDLHWRHTCLRDAFVPLHGTPETAKRRRCSTQESAQNSVGCVVKVGSSRTDSVNLLDGEVRISFPVQWCKRQTKAGKHHWQLVIQWRKTDVLQLKMVYVLGMRHGAWCSMSWLWSLLLTWLWMRDARECSIIITIVKPLSAQCVLLRKPARKRVALSATAGIISALAPLLIKETGFLSEYRQASERQDLPCPASNQQRSESVMSA